MVSETAKSNSDPIALFGIVLPQDCRTCCNVRPLGNLVLTWHSALLLFFLGLHVVRSCFSSTPAVVPEGTSVVVIGYFMKQVRCNVQHSSSRVSTLGAKESSTSGSAVPENRSKVRNSRKKAPLTSKTCCGSWNRSQSQPQQLRQGAWQARHGGPSWPSWPRWGHRHRRL
jgi:hypothetical protein